MDTLQHVIHYSAMLGVTAFGISGALVAINNRMDLSGAITLAFITGTGGGTVRDLILHRSVFWMEQPGYFWLSILPGILFFLVYTFVDDPFKLRTFKWVLGSLDTFGLAAFAISSTSRVVDMNLPALFTVVLGVVGTVGGGILRDTVARNTPHLLKSEFYLTPVLAGTVSYVYLRPYHLDLAIVTSTLVIIVLRVLGMWRRWHLPCPPAH